MKLKKIAIALITVPFIAYLYKKGKSAISGEWIIKEGWFDKSIMILERLNKKIHTTLGIVLVFEDKNTISQQMHNPEELELGSMGKLYFNEAYWKLNDEKINFNIKGGHVSVNKFHYEVDYTITAISKNLMTLKREEAIILEEKSVNNI